MLLWEASQVFLKCQFLLEFFKCHYLVKNLFGFVIICHILLEKLLEFFSKRNFLLENLSEFFKW